MVEDSKSEVSLDYLVSSRTASRRVRLCLDRVNFIFKKPCSYSERPGFPHPPMGVCRHFPLTARIL